MVKGAHDLGPAFETYEKPMRDDIARLRAENDWLRSSGIAQQEQARADIASLRAEVERLTAQGVHLADALHAGQREIERLTAQLVEAEKYNGYHQQAMLEVERLRAALREVDQYLVIGGKAEKVARRALGDEAPRYMTSKEVDEADCNLGPTVPSNQSEKS